MGSSRWLLAWLCVGACSSGSLGKSSDAGLDSGAINGPDASQPPNDAGHDDHAGQGGHDANVQNGPSDAASSVDAGADGARPDASADAAGLPDSAANVDAARPLLANAGVQLLVGGERTGLQLTAANIADDADVVAVHFEFDGVPWSELEAGQDPPPEWTTRVDALAKSVKALNRPVFLSISMLNGSRRSLASRTALENGKLTSHDNWAANCYDFASAPDAAAKRSAYLRYVRLMIAAFAPHWLNYAIEINLYFEACPAGVPGLIGLANQVYDAAKLADPTLLAFSSVQIDHLHGYAKDSCPDASQRDQCFEKALAELMPLAGDRFAMSSYPFLQGTHVQDLPVDWFERAATRLHKPALIAETGWLSTNIRAQLGTACQTPVQSTPDDALAYLDSVLAAAKRGRLELVTWWSDRDLLPAELMTNCPCSFDPNWCNVVAVFRAAGGGDSQAAFVGELGLKAFGTMGLRDYAGNPKPLLEHWQSFRR